MLYTIVTRFKPHQYSLKVKWQLNYLTYNLKKVHEIYRQVKNSLIEEIKEDLLKMLLDSLNILWVRFIGEVGNGDPGKEGIFLYFQFL